MRRTESTAESKGLIQNYLDELGSERRYSPNTVKSVGRDLALLPDKPFDQISGLDLKAVLVRRHAAGAAASSLARLASSWRGFFAQLQSKGITQSNPTEGLKTPKAPKRLPKALSVDQVNALLDGDLPKTPHSHTLAHLLLELLYATGLRISEAISLRMSQAQGNLSWISLEQKQLQVLGKGGKVRLLPLTDTFTNLAAQWVEIRKALLEKEGVANKEVDAFLLTAKCKPYTVRQAQKDVAAYARHKGLSQQLHPHMMRHSFGSHLLQDSQNLRAVQELLGHASIVSTQVYTALDFKHLAQVYDDAFPRAKKE